MAVAMEVRIGHLGTEFFANALVILCPFHTAGAVATGVFQALFYGLYHFGVIVESNCHSIPPFPYYNSCSFNVNLQNYCFFFSKKMIYCIKCFLGGQYGVFADFKKGYGRTWLGPL